MTRSPAPDSFQRDSASASPAPETTGFNISNEEAIRRLRAKGQPIRLFGESDRERRLRLRALELIEERDHDKQGGQNDFKKALEDVEMNEREKKAKGKEERKKEEAESSEMALIDLELVTTNPTSSTPDILCSETDAEGEATNERPGKYSFHSRETTNSGHLR